MRAPRLKLQFRLIRANKQIWSKIFTEQSHLATDMSVGIEPRFRPREVSSLKAPVTD
jgi:hypothetical protein